jgi:hypothetical protein
VAANRVSKTVRSVAWDGPVTKEIDERLILKALEK